MYKFDVPLKLTSFARGLSDGFVDNLITIALTHTNSPRASKRIKLMFDTACRNEFQVKGFRNVSSAPAASLVKKPLVDLIKRSENVVWAILNVWFESRSEIREICQAFLTKKDLTSVDFSDLRYGFNYAIMDDEINDLVNELHAEIPSVDRNEIRLMIAVLLGQAPISSEEIKDYPGVFIEHDISSDAKPTPQFASKVVDLPLTTTTSGGREQIENILSSQTPVPSSSSQSMEKFKDTHTALDTLNGRLNKAKELLSSGDLSKLNEWSEEFEAFTREAITIWEKDKQELTDHLQNIITNVRKSDLHENDKEIFVKKLEEAFLPSKTNPHFLIRARKSIEEINEEAKRIAQSIKSDLEKIYQTVKEIDVALQSAQQWGVQIDSWRSQITTLEEAKKQPREAIERSIKINREIVAQIREAVEAAKAGLIEQSVIQASDLLPLADEDQQQKINHLISRIYAATSRDVFVSLSEELQQLTDEINLSLSMPDIVEAARIYQKEPDPGYLEVLIDGLAKNRRHNDVYLLLTILLSKGIWKSGTSVEKHVIDSYFIGFRDQTPSQDLFINLVAHLKETQLLNQIKLADTKASLGVAILYLTILAVRPDALAAGDLWQIYNDELKSLSPFWGNLLEQTLQGNLPSIRDSHALPSAELNQVTSFLDMDLLKEGGRYVRVRGRNSIVMTNMEQQYLLPLLDEKWQRLKNSPVGGEEWGQFKDWLSRTDANSLFEEVCHNAKIDPGSSPFYRPLFEERIRKVLMHFERFIKLKEDIHGLHVGNFVLLEDVLNDLQNVGNQTGEVYIYLAQSILSNLSGTEEIHRINTISTQVILEKRLIETEYYWKEIPLAVSYIGSNDLVEEGGDELVSAVVTSFADMVDRNKLAEFYLENNLPQIAEVLSPVPDIQSRANELKQKNKETLLAMQSELKTHKQPLSESEETWLADQRWNLLFKKLDSRIEEIKNQESQRADQLREKYANLVLASSKLDVPIMQAGYIPPTSKEELHAALDEIRYVGRRELGHCIDLAENLLSEINHILDYQDANLEGVTRSHSELKDAIRNNKRSLTVDPSTLNLNKYVQALRSGNYDSVGISHSVFSDSMIEDRIDLLKSWDLIKGYPINSSLLLDHQVEDLRQFFRLFAKIVRVEYGESASGKSYPYLFRKPVVHFESNLMKSGTQALQRNLILLALTEDINPRLLKEIDRVMDEEDWLRRGKFVIWFALNNPEMAHDWVRRRYPGKSVIVIDENAILRILFSGDNPTSTGFFKRILLRTVDTHSVSVFWYENWVDNNKSIFVGRDDWIRSIVESGQSYAVYGGRRIGKSSLLKALEGELGKADIKSIYIDLEGARSLNEGITAAQDILERLGINEDCNTLSDFHRLLTKYFQKNPDSRVVVLFDELDPYIRERRKNNENHTLIETCRNLFSEHRSNVRFVMAGFIELWKQLRGDTDISGQQNPYKNFLHDRGALAALQSSDAQKIVKEGFQETLGFKIQDPAIPRKIIDITTGHPAFVQKFCERLFHRLHSLGPEATEVQLRDVESVKDETGVLSFTNFVVETLDLNLNNLSQLVVYLMAATKKEVFSVDDINGELASFEILKLTREKIHESVQELLITGVFSTADNQYTYKFSVPSYAELLRQYDLTDKNYITNLIEKYNKSE